MKQPNTPLNEKVRLETLKSLEVLDSRPEERFDRLTRMAKRMFNVPIALVSLVDENRQWFESCVGLSENESEMARKLSFCGHVILDNEVFIIHDASADPRFADNPLVTGAPNIQFYAGCPLVVNGCRLGTLCIIDQIPRKFDDEDIVALRDLASTVELELSAMQLATHDALTGILNRRGFLSLAQNSLNLSIRNDFPVALVYFDLDEFKFINDTFGHAAGDSILVSFSNQLDTVFRGSDVVARLGGNEFAVLLNSTSKNDVGNVMEKFKLALEKHHQTKKCAYDILFSFGVVEFDSHKHITIDSLLADGDKEMYVYKNAKK